MKYGKAIYLIIRMLLAATFIFSGFVKAVDPWGTAIKIGEYLTAFGLGGLDWVRFPASIALSGLELSLGLALLFGVRIRLVSMLTMWLLACMTGLTLYSAIANPVHDCGCFGDAVKLTNWQTFFKNLILLPLSIALWLLVRKRRGFAGRGYMWLIVMLLASVGLGVYCYLHLPLVDFLPYRAGTDLRAAGEFAAGDYVEPQVVYRDKFTGKRHTFAVSDTTWYDSERWEWVETTGAPQSASVVASTGDFRIYDNRTDVTQNVLDAGGTTLMIIAADAENIRGKCLGVIDMAIQKAHGASARACVLTATPVETAEEYLPGLEVQVYNVDATTLKTMLRAHVGAIVLRDGIIVRKYNCRDLTHVEL